MSGLRDELAGVLMERTCAIETEHADWESGTKAFSWCETHYPDAQPHTDESEVFTWHPEFLGLCPEAVRMADAILAHLRTYLTSDVVVERAAYGMYLERPIELDQEGGDDWTVLPDEWKQEWLDGAHAALEAALNIGGAE